MKIFTNEGVYVQRGDISFLEKELGKKIPESIKEKAFGDGLIYTDSDSINSFVKFTDENDVYFFVRDYDILSYNEVRYLNLTGLGRLINSTTKELGEAYKRASKLLDEINIDNVCTKEMRNEIDTLEYNVNRLSFRIKSLCAFKSYKMKKLSIQFPDEVPCTPAPFMNRLCYRIKKGFMNI